MNADGDFCSGGAGGWLIHMDGQDGQDAYVLENDSHRSAKHNWLKYNDSNEQREWQSHEVTKFLG